MSLVRQYQNQNQKNHKVVGSGTLVVNERPWREATGVREGRERGEGQAIRQGGELLNDVKAEA